MELKLIRREFTDKSTIGELYVDDDAMQTCYTLEDVVRAEKVKGETAIPVGKYEVICTYSPRFKRDLPLLLKVPNFEGVRIHPRNDSSNTEGCILVGLDKMKDRIQRSRDAFNTLYAQIKEARSYGEQVWITIEGNP